MPAGPNIPPPGNITQPGGAYNVAQLEALWMQAGGSSKQAPIMAAIALAESGGRNIKQQGQPYATTGWGLWQITPGNAGLLDPLANAKAAVAKFKAQGLGAWVTYGSGAYKKFLGQAQSAYPAVPQASPVPDISIPNPLSGLEAIGNVFNQLTNPQLWLRVLEVLGGVVVVVLGLLSLTGQDAGSIAATAAKVAR